MTKPLELSLLTPHDGALQHCVYCPKLCRAACPVATVDGNETITPWGKMAMAYYQARGDVSVTAEHGASAWDCCACLACRQRCEHSIEVATVLTDARAEVAAAEAAPEPALAVIQSYAEHERELADGMAGFDQLGEDGASTALLMGCSYVRHSPEVARAIWTVASTFVAGGLRAVRSCCGLPLLSAGDRPGFERAARKLGAELRGVDRVVVADPGCARTLLVDYPRVGVAVGQVELLVDRVFQGLERLPAGVLGDRFREAGTFRYHDPCQLGRGLGRYEEPRRILEHLCGEAPAEFQRAREAADCSGAGGLLAVTRPELSRALADERLAEHRALGGGLLVTGCGESLRRFRSCEQETVDIMSLVAEAWGGEVGDG